MWGSGSHLLQLSLRFFLSFNRFQNCFLWSHFQLQTLPPHCRKYHLSLQMQIGHWIQAWLFQSRESRDSFSVIFGVSVSCSWLNLVPQLLKGREAPARGPAVVRHTSHEKYSQRTNCTHVQLYRCWRKMQSSMKTLILFHVLIDSLFPSPSCRF